MNSTIYGITAREILDSRGNPTIETTVILSSGYRGTAAVPAGASKGKYEALELRDNDEKRYNGMGVLKAVHNVTSVIAPKLRGQDALNQKAIDTLMIQLDGTENKSRLGGNAILSVSMATAIAAANYQRIPLYRYINALLSSLIPTKIERIPTPMFNVINGGMHGAGNLNFQEFHVVPASNKQFSTALQIGDEVYHYVKGILDSKNLSHCIGDEGGFAPNLYKNIDAMEILTQAIKATPYRLNVDIFLGLDVASSHFKTFRGYEIKDRATPFSAKDFILFLIDIHETYRLLFLEDPIEEDDWFSWKEITRILKDEVHIVGDDLLATNPKRLKKAIDEQACSAILLKPNQICSLTEFLQVVAMAKEHGIRCITSHRSGETNDTYIADIAVGIQSEYVKFGAPARGERVAKYNRLLAIEQELFAVSHTNR
ncbi:MAG: phosphopyruvate hydratase [Patescibacteria group bacterium]|nr:phosphopyruvate hydratase [Patescibacteria group bacterium]